MKLLRRAPSVLFPVVLSLATAGPVVASSPIIPPQEAGAIKTSSNLSKLPMSFAANRGQSGSAVRFTAQGAAYSLLLTDNAAVFSFPQDHRRSELVRLKLEGAVAAARMVGESPLPGKANYFLGSDPAKWRTSVPTFAKVRYAGVYSGIDLVYYGNEGRLEYDFVVAPNSDLRNIRLRLDAVRKLEIDSSGNLKFAGPHGAVVFSKPVAYQLRDGQREQVDGRFSLSRKGRDHAQSIGFHVGSYDHSLPLVIDPVLVYSTYLGGSGSTDDVVPFGDGATAVAVDQTGSAYVTGYTGSFDFPVTAGALQTANNSTYYDYVAFVTKINPQGTALEYSTYLGNSPITYVPYQQNGASASAIAVDSVGDAYIAGEADGNNFPVTSGSFQQSIDSHSGGFIARLNPAGDRLLYATYLEGANATDIGSIKGIAVDVDRNIYVTGQTYSNQFPVTLGAYLETSLLAGTGAGFVTKIKPWGRGAKDLLYSTYFYAPGNALAVDGGGNIFVTGYNGIPDFPVTPGAYQAGHPYARVFLSELSPAGKGAADLLYSTVFGGSGTDYATALALDSSDNVYIAGSTESTDFPVSKGAYQKDHREGGAGQTTVGFISEIHPAAQGAADLVYSSYLGGRYVSQYGGGGDAATGVALDPSGNVYLVGLAQSVNFPVTPDAYQATLHPTTAKYGNTNAFFTEMSLQNKGAKDLIYSTYFGGSGGDRASAIAIDPIGSGHAIFVGTTDSTDFPVTDGAFQTANRGLVADHGFTNGFVTRFDLDHPSVSTKIIDTVVPSVNLRTGQALTFTVQVSAVTGNTIPTGTIKFEGMGEVIFGTLDSSGEVTFHGTAPSAGTYTVSPTYLGAPGFEPSKAATMTVVVEP